MEDNLQKHTVRLFPGQLANLRKFFPNMSQDQILRSIIAAYIKKLEKKEKESDVNNG
jgi:hypothetical protein